MLKNSLSTVPFSQISYHKGQNTNVPEVRHTPQQRNKAGDDTPPEPEVVDERAKRRFIGKPIGHRSELRHRIGRKV